MPDSFDFKSRMARLPQLGALKAFAVAARYESFVAAAQELHVTHGAISKQVKNLEESLGEPLFLRRNRAVFLTDRGRQLAARLSSLFLDLENIIADFRSNAYAQPLIVSCEPTLCLKFLIPNLGDLKESTGLDVKVLAAGGKIDFRRDHVDLAVRRNDFPIDPRLHVKELAPEAMGMVCAPQLAASLTQTPRPTITALHTRSRPDAWLNWRKTRNQTYKLASDIFYEHFYLAIEAAMAGQGVALASVHMVTTDMAAGRLAALGPFHQDGTHYLAVSNSDFATDERRLVFTEWLSRRMRAHLTPASAPRPAAENRHYP